MIGKTIYVWDENRRVYPKEGGIGRAPIWREHFRPHKVVGETSRSWVTEHGPKVPKKRDALAMRCIAFSVEEIDRLEFINVHAYRISEEVRRISDYDALRKVADLIGYKPKEA